MKFLLDSHTFLWSLVATDKLSADARSTLLSPTNEIFLSAVSLWELSLKFSLGKLELHGVNIEDLADLAEQTGFATIPLTPKCAASFHRLPKLAHRDPFDRMLVWQCIQENFTLITKDAALKVYQSHGLKVLW